jgi:hypothetical protein
MTTLTSLLIVKRKLRNRRRKKRQPGNVKLLLFLPRFFSHVYFLWVVKSTWRSRIRQVYLSVDVLSLVS